MGVAGLKTEAEEEVEEEVTQSETMTGPLSHVTEREQHVTVLNVREGEELLQSQTARQDVADDGKGRD